MTIQKSVEIIDNNNFYNLIYEDEVAEMLNSFKYDYKTCRWRTDDDRFKRATNAANVFLSYYNDGYLGMMLNKYGDECDALSDVEFYFNIHELGEEE